MDFSSLVLMEKDKAPGFVTKELGSFEVEEGALYVVKLYVIDNVVNLYFDTNKDVEEWEYSAIFDLFNQEAFVEAGFEIKEDEEEYNPTYILKMPYIDDYSQMKESLNKALSIIKAEMENVFEAIKGKEEEYK